LFRGIDCLRLPVPDLDEALAFYHDALGHELAWRSPVAAAVRCADGAEIVLYTDGDRIETDLLVEDVVQACDALVAAGGEIIVPPFGIQIGRCAVVLDPWKNALVILDMSKGRLVTDEGGRVTGIMPAD
jgi:predicted enzyme related to lactoylglutathione lyase